METYTERDRISNAELELWFNTRKNVLFYGDHGVGKTSLIKGYWDSIGIKSAIFSGSTLDPYIDLIGIPKLVGRGKNARIEFALPKTLDEDVEAIFFDEYNRSAPAVRNSVLELIQFKSINGRKFPNLKVVWAAANPKDSDHNYDVDDIDPAQEDRFQIIVKLSGKPDEGYFSLKYGKETAKTMIDWHANQPEDVRKMISPRRLDYAMEHVLFDNGKARDVFPDKRINIPSFTRALGGNKKVIEMNEVFATGDEEKIKIFFSKKENTSLCIREILSSYPLAQKYLSSCQPEEIIALANSEEAFAILVAENAEEISIASAISDFRELHGSNPVWLDRANRVLMSSRSAQSSFESNLTFGFSSTNSSISIGDISCLVGIKSEEDIIDEIKCPESQLIYILDSDSAKNILKFFSKINFREVCERNTASGLIKKSFSLIYSAFNFFLERDKSFVGASYECKGCEKLAVSSGSGVSTRQVNGGTRAGRIGIREKVL